MLPSDIETPGDPCALIEGARFGDADFYGKWLLAAADAEALWKMITTRQAVHHLTRRRYP
jgi:hypothetical protein